MESFSILGFFLPKMGACHTAFKPEKMRTIQVKRIGKQPVSVVACKQELENLQNCWRTSGTDSRNCAGLVTSLAACIAGGSGGATKLVVNEGKNGGGGGNAAIGAVKILNATIKKYLKMK